MIRFTKMHGAGNDYIYINVFEEPLPADVSELARRMSHRHFGIGGDGLILIRPSEVADARMQMFNADGTEAEMCGNGIRCVARLAWERGYASNPRFHVNSDSGPRDVTVLGAGRSDAGHLLPRVVLVRVGMGIPVFEEDGPVWPPCTSAMRLARTAW